MSASSASAPRPADLSVDLVVLGAGTAGLRARVVARARGLRVLLVDPGPLGTTCARVGCMPSKLLIAAAEAAHAAEGAHRFGADLPRKAQVDGPAVMARVRSERDRFVGFTLETTDQLGEDELWRGRGRLLGGGQVGVTGADGAERVVSAGAVVIATGSRPQIFPMFAALGDRMIVNDDVFDWTDLPESVAVFGPGVIGLELGQALHRLGVRVRIFGVGGAVGPLSDPQIRAAAQAAIGSELPLHPDARIDAVERTADGVRVRWVADQATGGPVDEEEFALALIATGRRPNTDQLGLEALGLALDRRGLPPVDPETLQVGGLPVFLAGDALAERPLLHEAADEGAHAGENAARLVKGEPLAALRRRSALSVLFTSPQIALVGQRWAALDPAQVVVGAVDMGDQGRSRVGLRNQGRIHVYAARGSMKLLGAELVGPDAEHLAHLLAWTHQLGLTVPEVLALPFYHPVVEEGLRTALRDAAAQLGSAAR
ncbi:MAG: Dihydrolipoyl dehydrogenase [Pseudomonadota bacterium]|jgi:dihydrolipoamide dehydrogenase